MKKILIVSILAFSNMVFAKAPSHETWNGLLKKYVSAEGKVNYKGFKSDAEKLKSYLSLLSSNQPDEKTWSGNEQKTYWINAYNAFTVKLILDNYPLKSINEVEKGNAKSPWDVKFIKIGNETISLNTIEHDKLRKVFGDARFHFVLVCAAKSCPILLNEAYSVEKLETQLETQAKLFLNDKNKNSISKSNIKVSKLFEWYATDFQTNGITIIDFINKYSTTRINQKANISYLEYSWDLNE